MSAIGKVHDLLATWHWTFTGYAAMAVGPQANGLCLTSRTRVDLVFTWTLGIVGHWQRQ